jgi:Fe2+ or Zn2+ uptake regulation protein
MLAEAQQSRLAAHSSRDLASSARQHRRTELFRICERARIVMTDGRCAILEALVKSDGPADAVTLLKAARVHVPRVRIGALYLFMQELTRAGCVRRTKYARQRATWSLCL